MKYQIKPDIILTNHSTNIEWLTYNDLDSENNFQTIINKNINYTLDPCINSLMNIIIQDSNFHPNYSFTEKYLILSGLINISSSYFFAIAGLAQYLTKGSLFKEMEGSTPIIHSLHLLENAEYLRIDHISSIGLQIFADDMPLVCTNNRHKEGHSLYSMLDRTRTSSGSKLLKIWLKYPLRNIEAIQFRHHHIKIFLDSNNSQICQEIKSALNGISDIFKLVGKFSSLHPNVFDWVLMNDTLMKLKHLYGIVTKFPPVGLFSRFVSNWDSDLNLIVKDVTFCIDWESVKSSRKIQIRQGIWSELDDRKKQLGNLDQFLTHCGVEDIKIGIIPQALKSFSYTYMPQLGYLIVLPIEPTSPFPTSFDDMRFLFKTDENMYFKNSRCITLDEKLGDLQGIVNDMEAEFA